MTNKPGLVFYKVDFVKIFETGILPIPTGFTPLARAGERIGGSES